MTTPSEKKAMLFLAAVAVLGVSVRALRAVGVAPAVTVADSMALDRQLAAVDSARAAGKHRVQGRGGAGTRRAGRTAGILPAPDHPGDSPGLTVTARGVAPMARAVPPPRRSAPLDLDVATLAQVESLPWIGPVLAQRIVSDREARGAFGSLANLRRVKGIGPALAGRLDSMVTFSGTPRPSSAASPDSSVLSHPWGERRPRRRPP